MKEKIKSITVLIGCIVAYQVVLGSENDTKYEGVMLQKIGAMYQCQSADDFIMAANNFQRIAEVEKGKWEPLYYQAYSYLSAGGRTNDNDTKDKYFDKALELADAGLAISENNAEFFVLKCWAYSVKISVDPANRGRTLSAKASEMVQKALALSPQNPRAMFMLAQLEYGTAMFMGNDPQKACDLGNKAAILAEEEQPTNKLAPGWAVYAIKEFQKQCSK